MNKTKTLTFSGNFLSKNDEKLKIDEFKTHFSEIEESEIIGNIVHAYLFEFEQNYLKINFSSGSSVPRNPNVVNIETKQTEPNPRQSTQIEPKEHFALIDFDSCLFWISNSTKKTMILEFITKKFKNAILNLRDVFDQTEFLKSIKKLDELRLSATPNLFSQTNTLSKALSDEIKQYEAVEAILHLRYQDKWIGNTLGEKIASLFSDKNNYGGIMISGRDARNFGILFNSNVISRKIDVQAFVDENEMFDSEEVFRILIGKIEDEKV